MNANMKKYKMHVQKTKPLLTRVCTLYDFNIYTCNFRLELIFANACIIKT